jgi:YHS domain-containing protein
MKQMKLIAVMLTLALVAALGVNADETKKEAAKEAVQEAPKELKNQTLCPVMGGKIDSAVFTDIQGQRVYHCCPMCSKGLKKDPDKYFKKAAEEGILFENVQTICPVSGEKLEKKSSYTDYEGRRVFFCCDGCKGPFKEDPQQYLSRLDAPAEKVEKPEAEEKDEHKGHGH